MIYLSLNHIGENGINVRRIDHEQMYHFSELLAIECCKEQHKKRHASVTNCIAVLAGYHQLPDDAMTPVINMNLGPVAVLELYRLTASIVARLAAVSASNCARELNDPHRRKPNAATRQPEFEKLTMLMDILESFSFCVSVGTSITLSQQATPKLARVH